MAVLKWLNEKGKWIVLYKDAILERLKKSCNLSDLTNVAEARKNLELVNEVTTHWHDNRYYTKSEVDYKINSCFSEGPGYIKFRDGTLIQHGNTLKSDCFADLTSFNGGPLNMIEINFPISFSSTNWSLTIAGGTPYYVTDMYNPLNWTFSGFIGINGKSSGRYRAYVGCKSDVNGVDFIDPGNWAVSWIAVGRWK